MFRRRNQRGWNDKLREFIWPQMGWRRTTAYFLRRVARLPGSSEAVAAGFAFGAAISFTPWVGFHLVTAALLAWLSRVNIVASAVGTIVGNPWTFPFIWVWIYNLGRWMGIGTGENSPDHLNFPRLFGQMLSSLLKFNFNYLRESAWPIFGPMLAGSIPTAILAWIVAYFLMKQFVAAFRTSRFSSRGRRQRRDNQEAAE